MLFFTNNLIFQEASCYENYCNFSFIAYLAEKDKQI